jgi:predicted transcriptional regulator of viral defense system
MKHIDYIYETGLDNYGIVTSRQAAACGVRPPELNRWVKNGVLERLGHGVYKLTRYVPVEEDRYAEACALVGEDAKLYGESVLAFWNLAFANPSILTIASPRRVRKKLPEWIRVVLDEHEAEAYYRGIPSQSVYRAILTCKDAMLPERLRDAADVAYGNGLVTLEEYKNLEKEVRTWSRQGVLQAEGY